MISLATIIKTACRGQFSRGMEDAVEAALKSHGARRVTSKNLKTSKPCEFAYVRNPNGTRSSPDFLVVTEEGVTELELKSSRTTKFPVWDSDSLNENRLYVLNMPKISAQRPVIIVPGNALISTESFVKEFASSEEFVRLDQKASRILSIKDSSWNRAVQNEFRQKTFARLYQTPKLDSLEDIVNKRLGKVTAARKQLSDADVEELLDWFSKPEHLSDADVEEIIGWFSEPKQLSDADVEELLGWFSEPEQLSDADVEELLDWFSKPEQLSDADVENILYSMF